MKGQYNISKGQHSCRKCSTSQQKESAKQCGKIHIALNLSESLPALNNK